MSSVWVRASILSENFKRVCLPKVWAYLEREREVSDEVVILTGQTKAKILERSIYSMKQKKLLALIGSICLVLALTATSLMTACAKPGPAPTPSPEPAPSPTPSPEPAAKPIVLKGISSFPRSHVNLSLVSLFIERVNRWSGGELTIDWLGGPEVMAAFDQPDALRTGAVDMLLHFPTGYLKPLVPCIDAVDTSQLTPWEERESGAFDVLSEAIAEANIKYISRASSGYGYMLYTNKKIEGIEDFEGLVFRSTNTYMGFLEALGIGTLLLSPAETYPALERGVVDGLAWPEFGASGFGFHEVTDYAIRPAFGNSSTCYLVNLDVWNKLPKHLQDVIMNVGIDFEYLVDAWFRQMLKKEWEEVILPAGMTVIQLPPDDAKKFLEIWRDSKWELIIKDDPVYGPKLKPLLSKK